MGQVRNQAGVARRKMLAKLRKDVEKERRPPSLRRDPSYPYRSPMGDASRPTEDWPTYLRRQTSRPGWSVARLAREANIHRATIFGWIKGERPNMASVRAVAEALGDDPANAAAAAAGGTGIDEQWDPNLMILVRRLADPGVPQAEKTMIKGTLRYLAELAEEAEQAERSGRPLRRKKRSA